MSWTLKEKLAQKRSRGGRGGELDSQGEASPEEIKRREVSWTIDLKKKLAQKRSRAGSELDSHEKASPEEIKSR